MPSLYIAILCIGVVASVPIPSAPNLQQQTFYSAPVTVDESGIGFVDGEAMPWVDGSNAIVSLHSDLIDADTLQSVPLSQAYMHHWFLVGVRQVTTNRTINGTNHSMQSLQHVAQYGAGSEFRGVPETMPPQHAVITHGDEIWMAQIHIIDLRGASREQRIYWSECRRRTNCSDGLCINPELGPGGRYYQNASHLRSDQTSRFYDIYPGGLDACNWNEGTDHWLTLADKQGKPYNLPLTAGRGSCNPAAKKGAVKSYKLKYTVTYAPLDLDKHLRHAAASLPVTPVYPAWKALHGFLLHVGAPVAEYHVPSCTKTDTSMNCTCTNTTCLHEKSSEWQYLDGAFKCISCPALDLVAQGSELIALGEYWGAANGTAEEDGHTYYSGDPMNKIAGDVGVVWASGHMHEGGHSLDLLVKKPGESQYSLLFTSMPKYGQQEGVAGDELGFVVGDSIITPDTPFRIPVRSLVKVVSRYDATPPAYDVTGFHAGREIAHTGVMGYMRIRVAQLDEAVPILPFSTQSLSLPGQRMLLRHRNKLPGGTTI